MTEHIEDDMVITLHDVSRNNSCGFNEFPLLATHTINPGYV